MKLRLEPLVLQLKQPLQTALGPLQERRGISVFLTLDGLVGRGEAMPWPAFGTEDLDACRTALENWSLDKSPGSLAEITQTLIGLESTPAARCAIESCLLEWLALKRQVPVCLLLAESEIPQSIQVSTLLTANSAAELATQARRFVEQGARCLKLKVGVHPLSVEAQRLASVRAAIGPDVNLRIDANGRWSEGQARSAVRGLESLRLELCEQPVAASDVEALRRLRGAVATLIGADESLISPTSRQQVLELNPRAAADVLVLKPMALGGALPTLALARFAASRGLGSYVTTLIDGPIAHALAVHSAFALPAQQFAHGLDTLSLFETGEPSNLRGSISRPGGIGLSL